MNPEATHVLGLYSHYKAGFLPVAGGILDQSNQYLQAMSHIDNLLAEHEKEQAEKRRRGH